MLNIKLPPLNPKEQRNKEIGIIEEEFWKY
jgi:hypothetical protein